MQGFDRFTGDEIAWIGDQLRRLRRAERDEQKQIRSRPRGLGFRISDWASDAQGFTASDFDLLVSSGRIIRGDTAGASEPTGDEATSWTTEPKAESHVVEAIASLTHPLGDIRADQDGRGW